MKIYACLLIFLMAFPLLAQAQPDIDFSFGRLGTDRINDIRIGIGARDELSRYLKQQYRHSCMAKKKRSLDICKHTHAAYTGRTLPPEGVHPVDAAVAGKLGFVPPGTTFVQSGLVIYLVSWPRKIVVDSVTPWEKR